MPEPTSNSVCAPKTPRSIDLPSPGTAGTGGPAVITNTRGWLFGGLCAICIVLGTVGGWGATAPLASAVIATGRLTVDTNRKRVQHLEGGIVADLNVRDGAEVKAGDVLIRLSDTRTRATLAIVRGAMFEELAKEARLIAERDRKDTIAWPEELRIAMPDATVGGLVKSQQTIFKSRRATLLGETQILGERIAQLKQEIAGLNAQRRSKDRQIAMIQQELTVLEGLLKLGQMTNRRVFGLKREAARLEGEKGELTADIARAEKSIGETKLSIIQKHKTFRTEVVSALRDAQAKLHDLRQKYAAALDVLNRVAIRAPVDGKVVALAIHAVDAVIKPGETILELVPSSDRLLVEVKVQPQDVDNLSIGQASDVRFLGLTQRTTPILHGSVSYVSADVMQDQKNGASFYLARIEIPEEEIKRLPSSDLQPGMPAEVMIQTGERTALRYLTQPMLDSLNRAWRED